MKEQTILTILETVFDENSDGTAIIYNDKCISYRSLDLLSNRLAFIFSLNGVRAQDFVILCVSDKIMAILSMVALLKLGAVYMPVPADILQSRLQLIIDNNHVQFALFDRENFYKYNPMNCFSLNMNVLFNESEKTGYVEKNYLSRKEDMVYVIYTSGTTGSQKCVIATHMGILNSVFNISYVSINRNDKILQINPLEFDGSAFEIWSSFLFGATLVLMSNNVLLNLIAEEIEKNKISTMFVTTRLFNSLVDYKLKYILLVKNVLFGGEKASIKHVRKFIENASSKNSLYNVYGPTECTIFSTYYKVSDLDAIYSGVPIGTSINKRTITCILNENLEPVNNGEFGELFIGGNGVSPGYLNNPHQTNEKFIFIYSASHNKMLMFFRTGDRVKELSDGNLLFLGRFDRTIKFNGFRIDLEEIERNIESYPGVFSVAVDFIGDDGSEYIVAYIIEEKNKPVDINSMKKFFLERNVRYMWPGRIVFLNRYPVLKNGKIDYFKLSCFSHTASFYYQRKHKEEPLNLETEILSAWKSELNYNDISVKDDFFDIGGDSLKAINVLEKLKSGIYTKLFLDVMPEDFFKYSTISGFIDWLVPGND